MKWSGCRSGYGSVQVIADSAILDTQKRTDPKDPDPAPKHCFVATTGPHYMIPTTFSDSQYPVRYLLLLYVLYHTFMLSLHHIIQTVPVRYHTPFKRLFLNAEVDIASGSLDKEKL
jgi:hypothetical protein